MGRRKLRPQEPTPIVRVVLFIFLISVVILIVLLTSRKPVIANVCPIDGQVAEWSKRQGPKECEYGHFSIVEKTTHTWSANCP